MMAPFQVNRFWVRKVLRAVASGLGAGRVPVAPGTAGSLLALPLWYLGGGWGLFHAAALVAVIAVSIPAIRVAVEETGNQDPPWVVIDEVAGMLLAATAIPWGWKRAAVLFALFRFFDAVKFGPVAWADARRGPFYVLADDLAAGACAHFAYRGLSWLMR